MTATGYTGGDAEAGSGIRRHGVAVSIAQRRLVEGATGLPCAQAEDELIAEFMLHLSCNGWVGRPPQLDASWPNFQF